MDQPTDPFEPPPASPAPSYPPPPPPPGPTSPPRKGRFGGCLMTTVAVLACLVLLGGLALVGVLGIGLVAALQQGGFGSAMARHQEHLYSGNPFAPEKIALIDVRGIILSQGDSWSQVASARTICEQLDQAAEDDAVKAIVLCIDSPGGEVTASDLIHHHVRQARQDHGKVVVALMESVAASGGLYVAVAADRIVAHRMTVTGSIGVIAQTFNYHQLLDKIGLQAETYKSGPMKDMLSGSRPRTEVERQFMDAHIKAVYDEFVRIVAAGRPELEEADIRDTELGDGRILSGRDAQAHGLVDDLGFFEDALALAVELSGVGEDHQVVQYQPPFSFSAIFSQLRADSQVTIALPGSGIHDWARFVEPGKAYFLPAR